MNRPLILLLTLGLSIGCVTAPPTATLAPTSMPTRPSFRPRGPALWISPSVPQVLRSIAEDSGIPPASTPAEATIRLEFSEDQVASDSTWVYALVAPFPTVLDGVSLKQLQEVWRGTSNEDVSKWPLWMTASTRSAFSLLWGEPRAAVRIAAEDALLDAAWAKLPSWGIVPFESIQARWKVLAIEGISPVRKEFDAQHYGLQVRFSLLGANEGLGEFALPATNRDATRLTTVIMSGTSALAREIAYQMEVKGIEYPARDIGDWLREADVLHVSHEISFDPTCPPPNPLKNRFYCGSPKYFGLFEAVGVDVVELTGNHIMDNGTASLLYTLDLFRQHGVSYFGGGANLSEARQPLLIKDHGNQIAFLGCIFAEPPQPLAGRNSPGANPCDWTDLGRQIGDLRAKGYQPIVTLQYKEGYSPVVMPWQAVDFRRVADFGAAIVSGSQSHVPLQMEFRNGVFIHYGLGNLFFGQMGNQPPGPGLPLQPAERYEFLDRHVFYDGRYINTELLTAMLEDYARPRPTTPDERTALLTAYFGYSGWLPLIPTPAPKQTPTLYPLLDFVPLPTYTPAPKSTAIP